MIARYLITIDTDRFWLWCVKSSALLVFAIYSVILGHDTATRWKPPPSPDAFIAGSFNPGASTLLTEALPFALWFVCAGVLAVIMRANELAKEPQQGWLVGMFLLFGVCLFGCVVKLFYDLRYL